MSPRSLVKLVVEGNFLATVLAMACKTSSWCFLYLHWSMATLQLFRVWIRVCCSPQRRQESFGFFFRRWRLALWGSMSTTAFNKLHLLSWEEGLHCLGPNVGSVKGDFSHHVPLLLKALQLRLPLAAIHLCVILLATVVSDFLVRLGSSAKTSLTNTDARNFFLERPNSCWRFFSDKCCTKGSGDVRSWLWRET